MPHLRNSARGIPAPRLGALTHRLHLDDLTGQDFERLCLWLLCREGYERVEHLAGGRPQSGIDLRARREGRKVAFQCKNTHVGPKDAERVVGEILAAPKDLRPDLLVLVVSRQMTLPARRKAERAAGGEFDIEFWCGTELDERIKRHPAILWEFFRYQELPPQWLEPPSLPDRPQAERERAWVSAERALPLELEILGIRFGLLPPGRTESVTLREPTYLALSPLRRRQWYAVTGENPGELDEPDGFQGGLAVTDIGRFLAAALARLTECGEPWALDFPTVGEWRFAATVGRTSAYQKPSFGFLDFVDSVYQCCRAAPEAEYDHELMGAPPSGERQPGESPHLGASRPRRSATTVGEHAMGFRPVLRRREVEPARPGEGI